MREQRYFILLNQVLREIGRFADRAGSVIAKQPANAQMEVLDKEGEYDTYKSGRLKLEDFVGLRRSAQWGDSYQALGLQDALAGEGEFPGDARRPRDLTSFF